MQINNGKRREKLLSCIAWQPYLLAVLCAVFCFMQINLAKTEIFLGLESSNDSFILWLAVYVNDEKYFLKV